MSLLDVVPELLESAAADVKSIGAELNAAHAAAAAPTTGLVAAGADEVSAAVAALFSEHGQAFQALSAQASTFHTQFVQALSGAQGAYAAAEAANASPLQAVVADAQSLAVFSPWQDSWPPADGTRTGRQRRQWQPAGVTRHRRGWRVTADVVRRQRRQRRLRAADRAGRRQRR